MKKSYCHLIRDDRSQIYVHKSNGLSYSRITQKLGSDRRTVDWEIKRNADQRGYRFQQAHAKAVERRRVAFSGRAGFCLRCGNKSGSFLAGDGIRSRLLATTSLRGFPESAEPGSTITSGWTGSGAETCTGFFAGAGRGGTGTAAGMQGAA